MTRTTRLRRITLQLRQMGFTDGCTRMMNFLITAGLSGSKHDTSAGQIVRGHFHRYFVTR